jgi:chemotaxis protein CheZ
MPETFLACDRRSEAEEVANIVRTAFASVRGDLSVTEAALLADIEELGRMIATARAEVTALRVDDITDRDIPAVTDELDAIVAHTAAATESILESCETLDRIAGEVSGETAATLQDATTRIYEAWGFQDITGQRITKVVTALKSIDAKVAGIIAAFGARRIAASSMSPVPPIPITSELLHGPQLPANAMDKTDIDKLLASFD